MNCRVCGGPASPINNFGPMPIANDFITDISDDVYRFELKTSFCQVCSIFQIDEQPAPEMMFHDHYPFFTGLSTSMTTHFGEMVDFHLSMVDRNTKDLFVVEIGSNDGTLLGFVSNRGVRHLGIDPSSNVVARAAEKGVSAEVGFFGEAFSLDVFKRHGKANIIFAANVICHIPDLLDFGKGIKHLLADDGQFIFEEPYVGSMIQNTSYDQIYDEHVYIFGATSVKSIFARVGLELVDALPQSTHGGSMRYVLMHSGVSQVSESAKKVLSDEETAGLSRLSTYLDFAERCEDRRVALKDLLTELKNAGSTVAGYAATSKSTTVLNYCGIGPKLIQYISDSTPEKQGRLTPGSHIPVISPEEMHKSPPDYLVLFAWNHEKEILKKEAELMPKGVKWIRFVPTVGVMER